VHAWAFEADLPENFTHLSNTFERSSGRAFDRHTGRFFARRSQPVWALRTSFAILATSFFWKEVKRIISQQPKERKYHAYIDPPNN
jgi:hypothetical protein